MIGDIVDGLCSVVDALVTLCRDDEVPDVCAVIEDAVRRLRKRGAGGHEDQRTEEARDQA